MKELDDAIKENWGSFSDDDKKILESLKQGFDNVTSIKELCSNFVFLNVSWHRRKKHFKDLEKYIKDECDKKLLAASKEIISLKKEIELLKKDIELLGEL